MRRARLVLALSARTSVMALGLTASAKSGAAVWTDQAGDGNGINNQYTGITQLDAGMSTPTSEPGRDIVRNTISIMTKKVKGKAVCDGFVATMTLSGPPVADTIYRINATTAENPETYYLEYDTSTGGTAVRFASSTTQDTTIGTKYPATVKGSTITWRFPMSDVKATNEGPGSVLKNLSSSAARSLQNILYVPLYDVSTAPAAVTYTICG